MILRPRKLLYQIRAAAVPHIPKKGKGSVFAYKAPEPFILDDIEFYTTVEVGDYIVFEDCSIKKFSSMEFTERYDPLH